MQFSSRVSLLRSYAEGHMTIPLVSELCYFFADVDMIQKIVVIVTIVIIIIDSSSTGTDILFLRITQYLRADCTLCLSGITVKFHTGFMFSLLTYKSFFMCHL
jgi:hypothetical protein